MQLIVIFNLKTVHFSNLSQYNDMLTDINMDILFIVNLKHPILIFKVSLSFLSL